jgi:hypothetical protein
MGDFKELKSARVLDFNSTGDTPRGYKVKLAMKIQALELKKSDFQELSHQSLN